MSDRLLNDVCVATGTMRGGTFYADDKRILLRDMAKLPDGPTVLRLERASQTRSLEDNRRYHGFLAQIAKQTGTPQSWWHTHYKQKFNRGYSTTGLSEELFRLYVDEVMADAAIEHGVEFIPAEAVVLGGE